MPSDPIRNSPFFFRFKLLLIACCCLPLSLAPFIAGNPVQAGQVFSFGENFIAQLGLGTDTSDKNIATPIDSSNLGGVNISNVSAGSGNSLALTNHGKVYSWGWNNNGSTGLGINSDTGTTTAYPLDISNLAGEQITQVSAGHGNSLILTDSGAVFSYGNGGLGQTGLGTTASSTGRATRVDDTFIAGRRISQISAGDSHCLLLAEDGTVFSFGWTANGRTGISFPGLSVNSVTIPTPIDTTHVADKKITQVSAGGHSLLLASDGTVFSFGDNGVGGDTEIATELNLGGHESRIVQVAAGFEYSLLLDKDGVVLAFGENDYGRTGLGTDQGVATIPTPIDTTLLGGKRITKIATDTFHSLLLAEDGTVFSMGLAHLVGQGPLADNALIAAPIDTTNLGGMRVVDIAASSYHSLILAVPEPSCSAMLLLGFVPIIFDVCRTRIE